MNGCGCWCFECTNRNAGWHCYGPLCGDDLCGWWVGPVWKLDGEVCVCSLDSGHAGPHLCGCGSSFEGCGHPGTSVGGEQ
jgi:hypothetical protein